MDRACADPQLSFDVAAPAAEGACGDGAVLVAADGRMNDDEMIKQAVARAEQRLAEQALRRARRLAQVNLWRSRG